MPFAIGIEHTKTSQNVGTLMRSAYNFGASMVFTVGKRYAYQHSDTQKTYRHMPVLHFKDWEDYRKSSPFSWIPIGVELNDSAINIKTFSHPKMAVYILGAEDNGLTRQAIDICSHLIYIPSCNKNSLNVSVAGSIVMFDRLIKI